MAVTYIQHFDELIGICGNTRQKWRIWNISIDWNRHNRRFEFGERSENGKDSVVYQNHHNTIYTPVWYVKN